MVLKRITLAVLCLGLLSSCSLFEPGISVLRGNYAYQQGDYQKSLLQFLSQDEAGNHSERIRYNIATVYYALGEGLPALGLWQESVSSYDEEVLFASSFNSGVVYYQTGRFSQAYFAFRKALEINPSSLDAKKNLELALERLEAEPRGGEEKAATLPEEVSDDARRILQYIKRKEGSRWEGDGAESDSSRDW